MIQTFLFGSYVTNSADNIYVTTNNLEITANIVKILKNEIHSKSNEHLSNQAKTQLNDFIAYAAPISYAFDRPDIAAMLYRECKSQYPKSTPSYDQFISGNLLRLMTSPIPRLHQSLIEISLYNAYKAFARNDKVSAAKFAKAAKQRWDNHMRKFGNTASRFTTPPFENIKIAAYARALKHLRSPQNRSIFKKRISALNTGLLVIKNNDSILDYSVTP
jgi:predicted N-acyltransferase